MLARLILIIAQVASAWTLSPFITAHLPWPLSQLGTFLLALVFAVVVWIVGIAGSIVMRTLSAPNLGTLSASVVFALAGAALTWIPPFIEGMNGLVGFFVPYAVYPLVGAVMGYMARG